MTTQTERAIHDLADTLAQGAVALYLLGPEPAGDGPEADAYTARMANTLDALRERAVRRLGLALEAALEGDHDHAD